MDIENAVGSRITTNLGELELIRLLGKGKSGYSYLAKNLECQYVVKLMHYEPCDYYSFGNANKVELEASAYNILEKSGVRIPELLVVNVDSNYLIKEYIEGSLVTELIIEDALPEFCVKQVFGMSRALKSVGINIDYFPDNFVMSNGVLYYIDYECNRYNEKWDLVNWGLYYWANAKGMKAYKETHDPSYINSYSDCGVPIKLPFEDVVNYWVERYC